MTGIERIRDRWRRATPGPWKPVFTGEVWAAGGGVTPTVVTGAPQPNIAGSPHDAEAIAAAPTDIALLLDVAEAAKNATHADNCAVIEWAKIAASRYGVAVPEEPACTCWRREFDAARARLESEAS